MICEKCKTDVNDMGDCVCSIHSIQVETISTKMNFNQYQKAAYRTIKPHDSDSMEKADWALGLGGEAGEVQELIKHNIMHKEPIDLANLAKEVGDVLWYCAAICEVYGINMDVVAEMNIAKLEHRHAQKYSREGSLDRHAKEQKFAETVEYQQLVSRLTR